MGRPILGSSHIFIKFAYDNFTLSFKLFGITAMVLTGNYIKGRFLRNIAGDAPLLYTGMSAFTHSVSIPYPAPLP